MRTNMLPEKAGLEVSPLKIDAPFAGWASSPGSANGETTLRSGEKGAVLISREGKIGSSKCKCAYTAAQVTDLAS